MSSTRAALYRRFLESEVERLTKELEAAKRQVEEKDQIIADMQKEMLKREQGPGTDDKGALEARAGDAEEQPPSLDSDEELEQFQDKWADELVRQNEEEEEEEGASEEEEGGSAPVRRWRRRGPEEDDAAFSGGLGEEQSSSSRSSKRTPAASPLREIGRNAVVLPNNIPSAGSLGHSKGICRPCFYILSKTGCQFGKSCLFCHEVHPKRKKDRPPKLVREDCKMIAKRVFRLSAGLRDVAEAQLMDCVTGTPHDEVTSQYAKTVLRALWKNNAEGQLTDSSEPHEKAESPKLTPQSFPWLQPRAKAAPPGYQIPLTIPPPQAGSPQQQAWGQTWDWWSSEGGGYGDGYGDPRTAFWTGPGTGYGTQGF